MVKKEDKVLRINQPLICVDGYLLACRLGDKFITPLFETQVHDLMKTLEKTAQVNYFFRKQPSTDNLRMVQNGCSENFTKFTGASFLELLVYKLQFYLKNHGTRFSCEFCIAFS